MRVIYMGTPDFAVNTLEAIIREGHEVLMVVTQPDKAKGRGKKMMFTPVKEKALEYNLPVAQPEKVKEEGFMDKLEQLHPDVIVVVAFGQFLPERILNIPKYGCINVHASLLPAYRGAAPIQWAVIDGLQETGVTTMYMAKGIDTGDIINQSHLRLAADETGGSLFERLADEGAKLLIATLKQLENGTATHTRQDDSKASYARMLSKEMGCLDFSQNAEVLERLIRGLNPWPSAYTKINDKTLKVFAAEVVCEEDTGTLLKGNQTEDAPGVILAVDKRSFIVRCGQGALRILNLQLEGKKRMDTAVFLLGYNIRVGMKLGY